MTIKIVLSLCLAFTLCGCYASVGHTPIKASLSPTIDKDSDLNSDAILTPSELAEKQRRAAEGDMSALTKIVLHLDLTGKHKQAFQLEMKALLQGHDQFAQNVGMAFLTCGRTFQERATGMMLLGYAAGRDGNGSERGRVAAVFALGFGSGDWGIMKDREFARFWFNKYVNKKFTKADQDSMFETFLGHEPQVRDEKACRERYGM